MKTSRFAIAFTGACALGACGPSRPADTFIERSSGPIARWLATPDDRIRVPLAEGLAWSDDEVQGTTLLRARSETGPTFVVVAVTARPDGATITADDCARAHVLALAKALGDASVLASPPTLAHDTIAGNSRPRVHYAVALEGKGAPAGASLMNAWTYFVDANSICVGVSVSTVVHARKDDATKPDAEDVGRLERVFALVEEGTKVR